MADLTVEELKRQIDALTEALKASNKAYKDLSKTLANASKLGVNKQASENPSVKRIEKLIEKQEKYYVNQMRLNEEQTRQAQETLRREHDYSVSLEKLRFEHVRSHKQMIKDTRLMEQTEMTKRESLRLMKNLLGQYAGGGLFDATSMVGLPVSLGVGGLSGAGQVGRKKLGGLSQGMLNYQQSIGGFSSAVSQIDPSSPKFANKIMRASPRLGGLLFGKMQEEDELDENGKPTGKKIQTRKGGALGKAAGKMGMAGGVLGMAGAGAGGLVGGMIMKGLESSPMFQAISKIMNTAFNLILRPIGDFFSAVFKPISIVLMKWGAVNLRKWAQTMQDNSNDAMKAADMIGKGLVAFFDDPLAFLGKAIEQMGEIIHDAIDPFYTAKDVLGEHITTAYKAIDDRLTEELGTFKGSLATGAGVLSGIETTVKSSTEKIDAYLQKMTPENYMRQVIAPNMTDDQKKAYQKFEGTEWAKSETGQATGLFDEEGNLIKEEFNILADKVSETTQTVGKKQEEASKSITGTSKEILSEQKETQTALIAGSEASINSAQVLEKAYEEIKRRLAALIRAQEAARTKVVNGKIVKGRADADLYKTQNTLNDEEVGIQYINYAEGQMNRLTSKTAGAFGVGDWTFATMQGYVNQYVAGGEANASVADWNNAKKLAKEMEKLQSMGAGGENFLAWSNVMKSNTAYKGLSIEQAGAKYYGLAQFANGGIISEPVFGIGRSGRKYLMGESGSEMVVPLNGGSGTGGVVVNINIAKMSSDIDLNQIKPIVERALLETHARRGII